MKCFPTQTALEFHENKKHNKKDKIINKVKKKYKCHYCSAYSTNINSNLIDHEHSHLGIRPFGCKLCPLKFTKKSDKKKHMKIHTLENNLFADIVILHLQKLHLRNIHINKAHNGGAQSFKCKKCDDKFETIMTYKKPYQKIITTIV